MSRSQKNFKDVIDNTLFKGVLSPYETKPTLLSDPHTQETIRTEHDEAMDFVKYIIFGCAILVCLFFVALPVFGGVIGIDTLYYWEYFLDEIDPFFWAALGIAACICGSVIGGTYGVLTCGASILGASIRRPKVATKNLISIIFCEAVGIYGVIMATILVSKYRFSMDITKDIPPHAHYQIVGSAYAMFGSGLCVGFGNLCAALGIGVVGGSTAIADAADGRLFVRMLVVEIFLEAIGIFSLVIGIAFQFRCDFGAV